MLLESLNIPLTQQYSVTYFSLGTSSLNICTVSVLLEAHRKSESVLKARELMLTHLKGNIKEVLQTVLKSNIKRVS